MKMTVTAWVILSWTASPAFADKRVDDVIAKSQEQLRKGKPQDALKTMDQLVSANPGSADAHLALGRVRETLRDFDGAAAAFAKAAELAASAPPRQAEALLAASSLSLRSGSATEAVAQAKRAAQVQPSPAASAALAVALARSGNGAEALAAADQALAAGPSASAHQARGLALIALGRGADAEAALRQALALEPKRHAARTELAEALLAQGKAPEALGEAKAAGEGDPNSAEAAAMWGTAILAANPDDWDGAIAKGQDAVFLNGRSPIAQIAVARIFEAKGRFDEALSAYGKALARDPDNVPARGAVINARFRKGDLDGAVAEAAELVRKAPENGEALFLYGSLLLRKERYDEAVDPLKKAAEKGAGGAEAYAFLGLAQQLTRRHTEARDAYKKAVELAPRNLAYRTQYGLLLGLTGNAPEGYQVLNEIVSTPGYKNLAGFANLGKVLTLFKPPRVDEALTAYGRALQIDPQNAQVHLGIAWAHRYAKAWDASIAAFGQSMRFDPRLTPEAENGIAWGQVAKRDLAAAKAAQERARRAGREDLRLAAAIERLAAPIKQAPPDEDEGPEQDIDIGRLVRALQGGTPRARAGAALALCEVGKDGVPALVYAIDTEKDGDVRSAIIKSLGCIGPAAKSAVPYLRVIANYQAPVIVEDVARNDQQERLKSLAREALGRIDR